MGRTGRVMVKTGRMAAVQQMTYLPVDTTTRSVEVMTFERLRELNDGGTQRADFHVLAVVDAGHGSVSVDFASHPLDRRSAVWIPPGAVHRWQQMSQLVGHLVLFIPTAPVTRATRALAAAFDAVPAWTVGDDDWRFVTAAIEHLGLEAAATRSDDATDLPAILLSALIARLHPPNIDGDPEDTIFYRFRTSVDTHLRAHHDAGFYARTLGYAPRTLSRASQRATGRTAKGYISDRLVLEAKRLLAHDRVTAARCAIKLGFPDASGFSAFFRNATGQTPGAWQATALDASTIDSYHHAGAPPNDHAALPSLSR